MQDLQHFARASDYFLGKTTDEISDVVLHVFEAHLRDICEQLILKRIKEGMGSFLTPWFLVSSPDYESLANSRPTS